MNTIDDIQTLRMQDYKSCKAGVFEINQLLKISFILFTLLGSSYYGRGQDFYFQEEKVVRIPGQKMNLLVGNKVTRMSDESLLLNGNSVVLIRAYNRYINENKLEFTINTDSATNGQLNIWYSKKNLHRIKVKKYSNEYFGHNNVNYLYSVDFESLDNFNIQIDLDTLEYSDLFINISGFSGKSIQLSPIQDKRKPRYAPQIRIDNSPMFYSNYRDTFFLEIKANLDLDSSKYYIDEFLQYIIHWIDTNQQYNVRFYSFKEFNHYCLTPAYFTYIDRYSYLKKKIFENKIFEESNNGSMNEIVVVLTSRVKYTFSGVLHKDVLIEMLYESG